MKNDKNTWASIALTDIFTDIQRGKRLKSANHIKGDMPYVSSSGENNGVDDFVSNKKGVRIFADCISFANSGSVGSAFYEPFEFVASDHITHLKNKDFNENIYFFLIVMLRKLSEKYNFNREINDYRISRERIMLPLRDDNTIDYEYMKECVQKVYTDLQNKYFDYMDKQLVKLGEYIEIQSIKEKNFDVFILGDLADIISGRDIYADERTKGNIPYITSGTLNNGIGYFVGNNNETKRSNAISVNRNGAVGEAFYHPYEALYGNDCRTVVLKDTTDPYVQMFFMIVISKQKKTFSYSRKLGTERLKNLRIVLPINKKGCPDYEYMSQYIKNLLIQKYQQYVNYKNSD